MAQKRSRKEDIEDYDSSFEDEEESEQGHKRKVRQDLTTKDHSQPGSSKSKHSAGLPTRSHFQAELGRAESFKNSYLNLNAFERHRKLINEYFLYYPGAKKLLQRDASKDRNDSDIIRDHHRFVWHEDEDADTWEKQLAKRYYDKLFKEYCICDLSLYKMGKVAMRWRTEKEVIDGNGQFICGAKKCNIGEGLKTWEVNFAYMEDSIKKNALVKLRVCPECSLKLNHNRKEGSAKLHIPNKSKKKKRSLKSRSSSKISSSQLNSDSLTEATDKIKKEIEDNSSENIWKDPVQLADVKTREEEFDDYLDDLFL